MQLGAQSLGLSLDRQLTRTGGLSFAGGPWNNYVMHAIATVMNDLRDRPGAKGLVWANGGYTTKHAFGVYSHRRRPPTASATPTRRTRSTPMPRRELAVPAEAAGPATVEAYTVMHDRDGAARARPSPPACWPTAAAPGAPPPTRPSPPRCARASGSAATVTLDADGTLQRLAAGSDRVAPTLSNGGAGRRRCPDRRTGSVRAVPGLQPSVDDQARVVERTV